MKVLKVEGGTLKVAENFEVNASWVAGKSLTEYLKSNQRGTYDALFGKDSTDARMTAVHAACVAAYPSKEVPAAKAEKADGKK